MSKSAEWQTRWDAVMMNNYGTPNLTIARGDGVWVWDADGNKYLDLVGGIAVSSLGHNHPALVNAVADQVATLAHSSNLAIHEPGLRLAEQLQEIVGRPSRVFLSQDGASANETALKIVRKYGNAAGRTRIIAAHNAFHGRTMGALALTGQPAKQEPFAPMLPGIEFVPYGDIEAMAAAVAGDCAGVFLEPVQGEAGLVTPPPGYLRAVQELCQANGALFVLDEVQSGIGRTGYWLAAELNGLEPDILTLAKGLAGGMPLGACVATGPAAKVLAPGDHGSTFGGNPVSCAAASAVIDTLGQPSFLGTVRETGQWLQNELNSLGSPQIDHVRGEGLWQAIVLTEPIAKDVELKLRAHGILVNAVQPEVIRLAPPLPTSRAELALLVEALPDVLGALGAQA